MKSWLVVDWRDGWRSLRSTPAVTTLAVLSLALGIGVNSALFSIYNGLILRTLPVADPHRLGSARRDLDQPDLGTIRAREDQIADGAFAWSAERFDLSASGVTDPVDGIFASGRMFDVLGISAVRGRTFTPADDDRRGGADGPVAVDQLSLVAAAIRRSRRRPRTPHLGRSEALHDRGRDAQRIFWPGCRALGGCDTAARRRGHHQWHRNSPRVTFELVARHHAPPQTRSTIIS